MPKLVRAVSPALDAVLGDEHPVLDHGFVRVVDYMGDDASIVQAARVSYGQGTKTVSEDRGLIRYLMKHRHTSPFEMCEIKLHVKLPVFVARQWVRHRMANINEESARYSVVTSEFYTPDTWRTQAKDNKQGSGEALDAEAQGHVTDAYTMAVEDVFEWYESTVAKDDRPYMVAREQARIALPLSTYTQWYWKIDLHNLLHFLRLRSDPHAQAEIRAYADVIGGLVQKWVPLSWEAFEEYVLHARTLSRAQLVVLNDMLALLEGNNVDTVAGLLEEVERDKILDKREAKEMKEIFGV